MNIYCSKLFVDKFIHVEYYYANGRKSCAICQVLPQTGKLDSKFSRVSVLIYPLLGIALNFLKCHIKVCLAFVGTKLKI